MWGKMCDLDSTEQQQQKISSYDSHGHPKNLSEMHISREAARSKGCS